MNGHPLTRVNYHKDFGVTFDCNLNFHQHISEVALKANHNYSRMYQKRFH